MPGSELHPLGPISRVSIVQLFNPTVSRKLTMQFWVRETRTSLWPAYKQSSTIHLFPLILPPELHGICCHCYLRDEMEESLALMQEEIVSRESPNRGDGASILC